MPTMPVGAARTSSCTAGRLGGLHMSCMAVDHLDHHFESTIITSTNTGGDNISGDVASIVDIFHRSRYDDSLPVIMDCNRRLSRVLSRILAEDLLDDFYNASTCDYENMDLLLLQPSPSSINTATTTTAATTTAATGLLILEGQCADDGLDGQLVPLAGLAGPELPVEPAAHNLKSFKRGATASMKTATGHEVYEDYYEDGLLVAAALTGSHQLCLMHNAGQQQVRHQQAGKAGEYGECPASIASNPSSAKPSRRHITTTRSRGCRAGWRANKLGLRQSSSQQSSQRLFGRRMKSGQQPAAAAKSGTVGLQPPALPASAAADDLLTPRLVTASYNDLRPSATTSSLLAADSTDSMSSAARAASGMGTDVSTVQLVQLMRQAAFSSFSAMGRLIWQQNCQSRRRLLTIDNGPPAGPVIGSAASSALAAAAAAPNSATAPTILFATTSAQKQQQPAAPAAADDDSSPDDVLSLCHHFVEKTDDVAVVTVVEAQLSGMSGLLLLDGYCNDVNDAARNNIIDEVMNINEAGIISNLSAVRKTAFCTAVSKLQTYAAITNWLLWQLNALEGSAEPVDPFDNDDGLCQQLKALMNDLDDSLVSFLCHMGVKEECALDIVSDNTSVNKKEAAAYLDPYQTIAVQELVNWRSSIICLYVKAITRAANHEDQVVEYDYSDDLEFHRNGGQAALSADLMPANLATLAAPPTPPDPPPDAARVNSSSPSSYSSCFAGLTVASALSEELRQKLLERFQSHLRYSRLTRCHKHNKFLK
ncbi:hypothetical protein CEUSTIGMA_g4528.t1 [Chlamydomonas eustigma]|uniref:Uncharacterized protein n=1 Tax=Chlamydomonas eustigma TaxID=1157962 RepID=A0A250X2G6_9CHLO|nr:hypothetical protein CEUSTIGMA_g4528.t1 [Chlamydomonas eustigma]|eukprot:GAX77082.1 hypothetical protein CEUSTIGMA_g4528.t1 [Chlamydomonas eustigma]